MPYDAHVRTLLLIIGVGAIASDHWFRATCAQGAAYVLCFLLLRACRARLFAHLAENLPCSTEKCVCAKTLAPCH